MLLLAVLLACSGDDSPEPTDSDTTPVVESGDTAIVTVDSATETGTTSPTADTGTPLLTGCAVDRWDPADFAAVYDVGPGQPLSHPNDVPWESIGPSTLVRIWADTTPYQAKWVLDVPGTETDPVVVLGVCDPVTGALPVIEGTGATTRTALDFWSESRGIIKIGGASSPGGSTDASWIYVEDLALRSARGSFTDDGGSPATYADNAAAIFVEQGANVTLRGNELSDCGNGLFVAAASRDVSVIGNDIRDNGNVGSIYEHNSYTEALGILFEHNLYGPLCAGCDGNNLKDRSAGTVIRYNRIEGGNRQLDLVDSGHVELYDDPSYRDTFVYGNVLIEPDGAGNSQIVHYGGDSGDTTRYRAGTLWFAHNTVLSERPGNTTLVRLSAADHTLHLENSIVASDGPLAVLESTGTAVVEDTWLPKGWRDSHSGSFTGSVGASSVIVGVDPGFVDRPSRDVHLAAGSPAVDAAGPLDAAVTVDQEFANRQPVVRADDGLPDLGAHER